MRNLTFQSILSIL